MHSSWLVVLWALNHFFKKAVWIEVSAECCRDDGQMFVDSCGSDNVVVHKCTSCFFTGNQTCSSMTVFLCTKQTSPWVLEKNLRGTQELVLHRALTYSTTLGWTTTALWFSSPEIHFHQSCWRLKTVKRVLVCCWNEQFFCNGFGIYLPLHSNLHLTLKSLTVQTECNHSGTEDGLCLESGSQEVFPCYGHTGKQKSRNYDNSRQELDQEWDVH